MKNDTEDRLVMKQNPLKYRILQPRSDCIDLMFVQQAQSLEHRHTAATTCDMAERRYSMVALNSTSDITVTRAECA